MGSEKFVHRPGGIVAHVVEDVCVAAERNPRASMADHLGDRVERNALAERQGAGGIRRS